MFNLSRTIILFATLLFLLFIVNACAGVTLKTIPAPPPSAKLRVYAIAVSNKPESRPWHYALSHQQFENFMIHEVGNYLRETGIYDFVSQDDIKVVLGNKMPGDDAYWWFRNDCELLKQIGKGLHADYAMIVARYFNVNASYKMILVNLKTGSQYSASGGLVVLWDGSNAARGKKILQNLYQKIFYDAKGDLLATAIRKGQALQKEDIGKPASPELELALAPPPIKQVPQPPAPEKKAPSPLTPPEPKLDVSKPAPFPQMTQAALPAPADVDALNKRRDFEKKLEKELAEDAPATDKAKLIVYDFSSVEQLNVVSLILSEALREELFMLGQYLLVNRENLQQVMQELKLQQSGLVDGKQMVELGKWLAANQAVTGRLAMLGSSYILQAKRTDIRTLGTMGLGSLKCSAGQEEELLKGMPGLARKLAGLKSDPH